MHDVVIIGAGVTGLVAANDLTAAGLDIVVVERAVSPGGKAMSERFGGFLMEHGPSTMNASMPVVEEAIGALGLAESRVELGPGVRKRYLMHCGRLSGISIHPAGFLLSGYLSPLARLSLLAEPLRPRRRCSDDESVFDFASRRFGRQFAQQVMEPMVGGIFMGESRALSVRAVFPRLVEFEQQHGSVIRGMFAGRSKGDPGRRLFSWRGGIATLPRSLARRLGNRLRTGIAVKRVRATRGGFGVETASGTLEARAVLLCVQPHVAAQLMEPLDPAGAEAAAAIPAPPAAVVFLGYRQRKVAHPLDGLGYLTTPGSGVLSGVQFLSTMFPGRAPAGHVAISAYVGGARSRVLVQAPADELAGAVHEELSGVLGISAPPVVSRVRQWPLGLPQYLVGHEAIRDILETTNLRHPGFHLAGNFLCGVSVGHCIASGHRASRSICEDLGLASNARITMLSAGGACR